MLTQSVFLATLAAIALPGWADPAAEVQNDGQGSAWRPETIEVSVLRVQERQRLLVEVRTVFGALGWGLQWAPESQTMTARQGERSITMRVNDPVAVVGARQLRMPSPPRMLWDKLYVPLRFAAEVTGCQAEYVGDAVRLLRPDGAVVLLHLFG